jgi:hypothetical protein
LRYVRASLADAARLAPDLDQGVEVDSDLLMAGKVSSQATRRLYELAKREKKSWIDDEQLWPLQVLVCPYIYALRPEHGRPSRRLPGRVVPLVLSAKLNKDGRLEADQGCPLPLIPRDYLDPSPCDVVLGTIEDADKIYAALKAAPSWNELRASAQELLAKVTGQDPGALALPQYEKLPDGQCLLQKMASAVTYIEELLDVMLEESEGSYPLYEALLAAAPDLELKSPLEMVRASAQHLGQMECRYPLSPSQRSALLHHLERPDAAPAVLAVDGPPGTGKTTLLLSAIATMWVQRAVDGAEAPLIIATSTNNQAVENILNAFGKVQEPEDALCGRWLPDIRSYGQFLPAKTQAESARARGLHTFLDPKGRAPLQHDGQSFESQEGLQHGTLEFLERFRAAFPGERIADVEGAAKFLHGRLETVVSGIHATVQAMIDMAKFVAVADVSQAACATCAAALEARVGAVESQHQRAESRFREGKLLRRDWKEHLNSEPFWQTLLVGLGFKSIRARRDELFCARASIQYEELVAERLQGFHLREEVERLIDEVMEVCGGEVEKTGAAVSEAGREQGTFARAYDELRRWYVAGSDGSIESIQAALDVGPRFKAFKLATHYWEARYLMEVGGQLLQARGMEDSRGPAKLERLFRRLAKLFPCSVATAYTLPGRLTGWMGNIRKPLFGVIDLLIADEAGQIPPEVGVLSFALARQALVVGDVDQLRPIWNVPAALDGENGKRFGLVPSDTAKYAFTASALAVSGSSLMRIAQRATPFSQHPQRGRGMFLSEHRRCWPEIIGICNALVYNGLLVCKRPEAPRKIVPSLGYVHIPGTDRYRGKSRENLTEAAAIAKWLYRRRGEIETAFQDEGKSFGQLVAVVTPFVAQVKAIRGALRSEFGADPNITVGTIDALQGAEYRIVIFSPTYGVGTPPGTTRFDQNKSILNVAISRAQDAFLVFGNMHLFRPTKDEHASAVVGRFLFTGGENELTDIPAELLAPCQDLPPGRLIRDLPGHQAVLAEALSTARFRLVIVSPFLTSAAIAADGIAEKIRRAKDKGVRVTVVSDSLFNTDRIQYDRCHHMLVQAGAAVCAPGGPSVHSKLVLVDDSWLVVGSFNWLSTPRDPRHPYVRYESSIRYDGNEAFQMIRDSLKDLREFLPR